MINYESFGKFIEHNELDLEYHRVTQDVFEIEDIRHLIFSYIYPAVIKSGMIMQYMGSKKPKKYLNNYIGKLYIIEKYSNTEDVLLYLDPPYMIKDNLYGDSGDLHKIFKHEEFFDVCQSLECHQLISYNSDNLIKDAFTGYDMSDYDLTYTMRSTGTYMEDQKKRKELVMKRYDI